MGRLKAICNAYKVNISQSTLNHLIDIAGTDMQNLINEIRKLIEYAGENGTIKDEDIEKVLSKTIYTGCYIFGPLAGVTAARLFVIFTKGLFS